jgi:hypothetical protein
MSDHTHFAVRPMEPQVNGPRWKPLCNDANVGQPYVLLTCQVTCVTCSECLEKLKAKVGEFGESTKVQCPHCGVLYKASLVDDPESCHYGYLTACPVCERFPESGPFSNAVMLDRYDWRRMPNLPDPGECLTSIDPVDRYEGLPQPGQLYRDLHVEVSSINVPSLDTSFFPEEDRTEPKACDNLLMGMKCRLPHNHEGPHVR